MTKFILTALLLCTFSLTAHATASAPAGTPINTQQAEIYLNSCVKQPSRTMDAATMTTFCQCTALHMQKHLTMQDLMAQSGNDQAARSALNKTLQFVYAPCIQYPVRALVMKRCQADASIPNKAICTCAADSMSAYTAKEAASKLPGILAANPNIADPAEAFTGTAEFQDMEKKIADTCARQ